MKNSKILSAGFLAGLFLLLLNDFFLKDYYHNWFTGKLSDFAGLFIFPIFLSSVFPKKPLLNYYFTALFFLFWKSELSSGTLTFVNSHLGTHFFRITDYTDFIAFLVLPLSYVYSKNARSLSASSLKPLAFSIALFSFYATSAPNMSTEDETRIVGNYHRIWDYEVYDKDVLEIGYKDDPNSSGYSIVLGPDIISYGANENFIIARINPAVANVIDTTKVEYAILVVTKDTINKYVDQEVYGQLTLNEYLRKRKKLNIPDSVILKDR